MSIEGIVVDGEIKFDYKKFKKNQQILDKSVNTNYTPSKEELLNISNTLSELESIVISQDELIREQFGRLLALEQSNNAYEDRILRIEEDHKKKRSIEQVILQTFLSDNQNSMIILDDNLIVRYASKEVSETTGIPMETLIGLDMKDERTIDFFDQNIYVGYKDVFNELYGKWEDGTVSPDITKKLIYRNGQQGDCTLNCKLDRHVEVQVFDITDKFAGIVKWKGIVVHDYTELEHKNKEFKQTKDVVDSPGMSPTFVWINDRIKNGKAVSDIYKEATWPIVYTSKSVKDMFGYTVEDLTNPNFEYKKIIHKDDLENVVKNNQINSQKIIEAYKEKYDELKSQIKSELINNGHNATPNEVWEEIQKNIFTTEFRNKITTEQVYRLLKKDGDENNDDDYIEVKDHTTAVVELLDNGTFEIVRYNGFLSDYSETRSRINDLNHALNHDYLTDAKSRKFLKENLETSVKKCILNNEDLTFINLDLNNFKQINDDYGHSVGDEVLIQSTQRMMSLLDGESYVSRIGGDEFVIILKNYNTNELNEFTNNLTNLMNENYNINGQVIESHGTSYGTSNLDETINIIRQTRIRPTPDRVIESMVRTADEKMYEQKDPVARLERYLNKADEETLNNVLKTKGYFNPDNCTINNLAKSNIYNNLFGSEIDKESLNLIMTDLIKNNPTKIDSILKNQGYEKQAA